MTASAASIPVKAVQLTSQRRRMVRTFLRNRAAIVGLVMVVVITLSAVGAPYITAIDPLVQEGAVRLRPPDAAHWLGMDSFGRDIWARILYAGRISLLVGLGSVLLGGIVGTVLGLLAGYTGGYVEHAIMRLIDILMAFPSLLLGLTVLAVLGSGLEKMILAIGLMLSPNFARVVHATTLSLKAQEFVEAARAIGARAPRIMARHVLPNILGDLVVMASLWTASAIRVEASLSFIGLGVPPPTPTLGNMIRDGTPHLINAPWLSVFPGLGILLTVLAFNLLGDGLRDVLDPRLQQ